MTEDQNLPVVVPSSTSMAMTPAQAHALADLWVSEHNRLPLRFAGSDNSRDNDGGGWRRSRRVDLVDVLAGIGTLLVGLGNLLSRGIHAVRRLVVRRVERDGFALDEAVEKRLRLAFADALKDERVRTLSDAEQRRHLGEVLFAAQGPP